MNVMLVFIPAFMKGVIESKMKFMTYLNVRMYSFDKYLKKLTAW